MRKIGIVTGTRAEYGILAKLIRSVHADPDLQLQLYVTGTHLSSEFGDTVSEIEADQIPITETIDILMAGGQTTGIAKAVGLALTGFAEAYRHHRPDMVVVLGDRFEILGAAQAAAFAGIPIAHIHGGEVTEGAFDEFIRHSLSKMSQLHFVAAEAYRKRVIQLGENPNTVFNVGAPGLDLMKDVGFLSKTELEADLGFQLGEDFFLVTYHPETAGDVNPVYSLELMLNSLNEFLPKHRLLITYPNPDAYGSEMIQTLQRFQQRHPEQVYLTASLGRKRYLSALKVARAVVGNSSSGLIEAPFFKVPTVNIGHRQSGRLKASSVIDCECDPKSISTAIHQALNMDSADLNSVQSLYGSGEATVKMLAILKSSPLQREPKSFYDVEFQL